MDHSFSMRIVSVKIMAKRCLLLVFMACWLSVAGLARAQEDGDCRVGGPRLEIGFDFLWAWMKRDIFPPMATTGNVNDAVPGALGQPNTTIILGGEFDHHEIDGGRISFAYWLFDTHTLAIEGNFFILEQQTIPMNFGNDGTSTTAVLAKPFFNPVANAQDADPRGFPGTLSGNVNFNYTSRLMGAEVNGRWFVFGDDNCEGPSISVLAGVRWLSLQEKYVSDETVTELPAGTGSTFFISDNFGTFNQYFGAQSGLQLKYRWDGNLAVHVQGKIATGPNYETLKIHGFSSVLDQFGTLTTGNQGLYAQPSNIGDRKHTVMAFMPEGSGGFDWEPFSWLKLQFGYTFMYLNKVIRPGESIDTRVNIQPVGASAQFGPPLPVAAFHQTGFWVQFMNFGVTFAY
jgi:hypothetical protein